MVTVVQALTQNQGFGTTNNVAVSAIGSASSVVVAFVLPNSSTGAGVTDNQSGTYTLVTSGLGNPLDADSTIYIYARHNITNAPTSINVSWTGSAAMDAYVYELAGVNIASPVGQSGRAESAVDTTAIQIVFTTTTDSEAAIGLSNFSGSVTITPLTGYLTLTGQPSFGSDLYKANVGAAGSVTVGATASPGTRFGLVAATFKSAAATATEGSRRRKGSKVHPGKRGPAAGLGHFYRSRRANFTNPNVTVALTGVAGTGAVGTLAPATSVATTGNAATSAVGTAAPSTTVAVTGNAAAGAVGTVSAQSAAIVGSRRRSMSAGPAVNPYNLRKFYQSPRNKFSAPSVTVALTGVSGTGGAGTIAPVASVALTGNAATGVVGTLTPTRTVAMTGNAATAAVGTLAPATVVPLTGVSATGGTGTISPQQAGSAAISGVSATGTAGTATPNTSVAATGVQATSAAGAVGQSRTVALTGASATSAAGNVNSTSDIVVAISGNAASAQVGSLLAARSIALSGLFASASVGRVEIPTDYTSNSTQRIGRKSYPGSNGTRIG